MEKIKVLIVFLPFKILLVLFNLSLRIGTQSLIGPIVCGPNLV